MSVKQKPKIVSNNTTAPSSEIVHITPELASKWFEGRERNRTISPYIVARYAEDMKKGRWLLSGEAIKFSGRNRCVDGQHRLAAVIESETAIHSWVVWGVDDTAVGVMDSGRKRSPGDMLDIQGVENPAKMAAMARWLLTIKYRFESSKTRTYRATNQEIIEIIDNHPNLKMSCNKSDKSIGLSPSLLGTIYYIGTYLLDKQVEAEAFATTFRYGISSHDLYENALLDPALRWRESLISRGSTKYVAPDAATFRTTVSVWNKYASHEPLARSPITPREFQDFEGLDLDKI